MLNNKQLYEKIKRVTKEKNITIKELEENAELKKSTIYNMKKSTPNIETVIKIAKYLNIPLDELLETEIIQTEIKKEEKELIKAYQKAPQNLKNSIDSILAPYKENSSKSSISKIS